MATGLQYGGKLNVWAWLTNLMYNSIGILTNAGAPTSGTSGTGAGKAGKGCLLIDTTNGILYVNTNTLASPTWTSFSGGGAAIVGEPGTNSVLFDEYAQDTITAGTTQTQAGATALVAQTSRVSTVATIGDGVKLPVSRAGLEVVVINSGANAMRVYGTGADTIDGQTNTVGVLQMANSVVIYTCVTAGSWFSEGLATGFGGPGLSTAAFTDSITANATQTQAAATALVSQYNRVTTSAASGNGVRLPVSAAGLWVTIDNQGANPIQVYGAGTDTINGIATATGISQAVKTIVTYYCTVAGNWEVSTVINQPDSIVLLTTNGAIPPHTPQTYVITKAGVLADTLAAPTVGIDDGIRIKITSATANAHTLTATALLKTGSASVNVATFAAFAGASLELMAYNGLWHVMSQNAITFS